VDVLKKIIDGCRMTKLNSLHLHLTDDDSFPIQLSSFPGLTDFTALTKEEV
jgi:N-acetyl-beta-hexosaminidase